MRALFIIPLLILLSGHGLSAQVVSAEYFVDIDPGQGNGIQIALAGGDVAAGNVSVPTTGLQPGLHWLHVRVKGQDGRWSHYESRMFTIIDPSDLQPQAALNGGEYFVDTDPGQGNGIQIALVGGDVAAGNVSVPTTSLLPGLHWLHVRVKGQDGRWSHYESRMFTIIDPSDLQPQAALNGGEYFVDTDPGQGGGTSFGFPVTDSVSMQLQAALPELPLGQYTLYLRLRDTEGTWSHYEAVEFEVSDVVLSTVSGTITYDNNASTPMSNVMVELLDAQNAVVATATTDASGSYSFSDVADGSYTVRPSTTKAWGGVSSIDITLYRRHIGNVPGFILQGIRLGSGDVNVSNTLTSIDLTIIKRRIGAQISSFASGDWLFEDGSITVSGGNVSRNIKAICYGDANGSYTPPQ